MGQIFPDDCRIVFFSSKCLHNFNGVLQICSALTNSSVFRLRNTWNRVSKSVSVYATYVHGGFFYLWLFQAIGSYYHSRATGQALPLVKTFCLTYHNVFWLFLDFYYFITEDKMAWYTYLYENKMLTHK